MREVVILFAVRMRAVQRFSQHHALCQQLGEGFIACHQSFIAHQFVEKTRVEQMEDGVLDAADVLIHRQPVAGLFIYHAGCCMR